MTTNQTIDGVPRACDALKCLTESFRHALQRGIQPSFSMGDLEFFIKTFEELRALLDAPAKAEFSIPDCPDCACVQDGQCLCIPSKPAAQPQGEPVAWANWKVGSRSYVPYRTVGEARRCVEASEISATQNGPYRVVPLYAEQPAPVALVLPEHRDSDLRSPTYGLARGWNACLDEVVRLTATVRTPEPLVMTDGLHTYEYVTGHNAAIDKMLGVKS